MRIQILLLFFSTLISSAVFAQCSCIDCPLLIPDEGTIESQLTISGATNPILGENGQRLRAVKLNFTHDAIPQLTIRLRMPNGVNFITLTLGLGTQEIPNVEFDICMMHCDETADPDPGINELFSWTSPWQPNMLYAGNYYPWSGCLNFPNGESINGTWILEFIDNTPGGGGELLGWSLEFVDNSGTDCIFTCVSSVCEANGGEITPFIVTACEGAPSLNLEIPIFFPGGPANPSLYDYYYIITDENGVILDIVTNPNLTAFEPGTYNVCGLSLLASDFPLLPTPNGSLTIADIQTDIDNNLYCADLSLNCRQVVIVSSEVNPEILGPDAVCANQIANFELVGLDVSDWTTVTVTAPFSFFATNLPNVSVTWLPGSPTRTICANYNNGCVSGTICKEVTIITATPIAINGPTLVCEGQVVEYTLSPDVDWEIDVIGGNLISQTQTSFQVEWFENAGINRVTVQYEGPCGTTGPAVLWITLSSLELPATLNSPDALCLFDVGQSSIDEDPAVTNYIWSGTGITIQSGQGTNTVQYTADISGEVEICLELESSCGNQGPLCETILIEEPIFPTFTGPTEACIGEQLSFNLEGLSEDEFVSFNITGLVDFLDFNFPNLLVTFGNGSATSEEICFNYTSLCSGPAQICIPIQILQVGNIEIVGPQAICEGQSFTYEITPSLGVGSSFEVLVNGGSLLSQSGSQFEVIWDNLQSGSVNFITLIIDDADCGIQEPIVFEVEVFVPPTIEIDAPTALCEGSNGVASVDFDAEFFNYIWSGQGAIILEGQGSNGPILFSSIQTGAIQLCVEAESLCGLIDPVCTEIVIQAPSNPNINPVDPSCEFDFLLSSAGGSQSMVTWAQLEGPSTAIIQFPNNSETNVSVTSAGIYTFEYLEDDGVCLNTNTIQVEVLSGPILEITDIICEGGSYQLVLSIISSEGPLLVNGNPIAGNQFISEQITSGESYAFLVTDNNNCTSQIAGSFNCSCVSNAGTMSDETLNACISSGETVAGVFNNDAVLDINDIGVFVLHDNPGPILGNILDSNETGIFSFLPGMIVGQIYFISYVVGLELNGSIDLDDPCLQVSIGQPVTWQADPVFSLETDGVICGLSTTLSVNLLEESNDVTWTIIDFPGGTAPVLSSFSDVQTTVEVSIAGSYVFLVSVSNASCQSEEEFSIEFIEQPIPTDITTECLDAEQFIVNFSTQIGWSISIPGIIEDGTFTSEPLPTSTVISLTISSDGACQAELSLGPVNCDCESSAGTMSPDTLFICETDGLILLNFNEDAVVSEFDTSLFVIHTLSGTELGIPLFFTDQRSFPIPAVLEVETFYFISNLVTTLDQDGNPDLNSGCLSISQGQVLYIFSNPIFVLPPDTSFCFGPASLTLMNSNDGTFSVLADETNMLFSFESAMSTLLLNPNRFGAFVLQYEELNGTCARKDTLNISFWELPFVDNFEINCDAENYIVELNIAGGQAPYLLNGTSFNGNSFISEPIPSNTPFSFVISDQRGCASDLVTLNQNCDCDTQAGQISTPILVLCDQENIDLNEIVITAPNTPAGYEQFFFLTDNPQWNPANILIQNEGSIIPWSNILAFETTYYVFAVITRVTDEGEPDLTDACLVSSNVLPVLWREGIVVDINGNIEACVGTQVIIPIQSSGTFPITLTIRNNLGEEIEVELTESITELIYDIAVSGQIIWEIVSSVSFCEGNASGTFIINAFEEQEIILSVPPEICNNSLFGATLDLNSLLSNNQQGIWRFNGTEIDNARFDADGWEPGVYELEFSTEGFTKPCQGSRAALFITVNECLCPEFNLPDAIGFCSSLGIISLDNQFNITIEGVWTIIDVAGMDIIPVTEGNQVDISDLEGVFQFIFSISGEFLEDCPNSDTTIVSIERFADAGQDALNNILCAIGDEWIFLGDFIIAGDEGGIWLNAQGERIPDLLPRNTLSPGANLFFYAIEGDLCPTSQSIVELILRDSLLYSIDLTQALCPEEESGITINTSSESVAFVFVNGVEREANGFILLGPGAYTLQIIDSIGCLSEELELEITAPEPIIIDLGADRVVNMGSQNTLSFTTNIPDEAINTISWLIGGELIQSGGRTLELLVEEDLSIQVVIATDQGCTATAALNFLLQESPVFIPNAFYPGSAHAANQRFGPLSTNGIESIESFKVFDRWGNKVWDISKIEVITEAVFWDGTFKGREVAEGVYVYKIVYTNNRNRRVISSGEVMLLK